MKKLLIIKKLFAIFIASSVFMSPAAKADKGVNQAKSFGNIYSSLCLKHINNLNQLRNKLRKMPSLPKHKAKFFLNGMSGSAWAIPDKQGMFVLAIPHQKNICSVYARRLNVNIANKHFKKTFVAAPEPLIAQKLPQKRIASVAQMQGYSWSVKKGKRKMLFLLTTDKRKDANVQALFTASITSR